MEAEAGVMWSQDKEAGNHQKLEETWNGLFPREEVQRDRGPANTLILDF